MENLDVNFVIDGFPCQGILNQEGNSFYLDVKTSFPTISYKPRKITCCHEQQVFVLYNNQISSRRIFPEFVVENYERSFFNTFEFCLDGLQDFLSVSEHYKGNVFCEQLKIDGVGYICECINDAEKTTVKITSPCQCVELGKIEEIVQRFVQLFTLLSYKRVTCTSIHIIDDGKKFEFFSWQCKSFSGNKNRHYSLLHAGLIYSKCLWTNILDNYFGTKNDFFELGLNGFVSLIDSDMFWQDEIIRICGIWDQYTKQAKVNVASLYSSEDFDSFFILLKKLMEKDCAKFSTMQRNVADFFFEKQESIKNFLNPHLPERLSALCNQFDKNISLIFPNVFSDLLFLVKARNKFAHGELNKKYLGQFETLYQAFRRIRLQTIVFIYQELGLPLLFICECIRYSLHDCVRNVELDGFVLAQIIKDIPFFDVDEKTWEYFSQPRIYSCFVYNPSKNMLELDKTTTELAWNEHLRGDEPFYGNYVANVCPNCKEPVYQNTIFIICGDAHKEINGSYLLNYEDVPAELKEKCEKQRTDLLLRRVQRNVSRVSR